MTFVLFVQKICFFSYGPGQILLLPAKWSLYDGLLAIILTSLAYWKHSFKSLFEILMYKPILICTKSTNIIST